MSVHSPKKIRTGEDEGICLSPKERGRVSLCWKESLISFLHFCAPQSKILLASVSAYLMYLSRGYVDALRDHAMQAFLLPSAHSGCLTGRHSSCPASILATWHAFGCPACILAARPTFWPPCTCSPSKHSGCPAGILAAWHAFWLPDKHSGCPTRILAARHAFWLSGRHPVCLARNVAALHAFCL